MGFNYPINVYFPKLLCSEVARRIQIRLLKEKRKKKSIFKKKLTHYVKQFLPPQGVIIRFWSKPLFCCYQKKIIIIIILIISIKNSLNLSSMFWCFLFGWLFICLCFVLRNSISNFIVKEKKKKKHILYPKIFCLFRVV